MVTRCETNEENRPAVVGVTFGDSGSMTRNTHRRGTVQESDSLRWILLSGMGLVSVLESSMWMWPMLRIEQSPRSR